MAANTFSLVLLVATMWTPSSHAVECPAFADWMPWSDQCLWFPTANFRQGLADACQISINVTRQGPAIQLPQGFQMPERCGHCSFKLRCKKRDRTENCNSLDIQKETCDEFGDVCTVAPHPLLGCRWNLIMGALKNCVNRPDIPEWSRNAIQKYLNGLPHGNCIEKDGQCKCCCHPYRPSEDGSKCEKEPEAQCSPFGEFNQWSQCLWYPLENIHNDIKGHCQLQDYIKGDLPKNLLPTPEGFEIPEKCGYCSFKARCRKRDRVEGCFSVDADKKACGQDDCPTCANVCSVQKIAGSCDWGRIVGATLMAKVENLTSAMPYWKKHGISDMLRHLPYGICKEIGGQCKCCCHPYEPNEDGSACIPTVMCSIAPPL